MNTKAHEIVALVCHSQPVPLELARAARDDIEDIIRALEMMLCWTGAIPPSVSHINPPTEREATAFARAALAKAKGE
jgi:hypothetical protein